MLIVNLSQNKSKLNYYISSSLLGAIKHNLKDNKKSILYLNKRWNFSSLICDDCSYYYKCKNCDVSLTVHNNPEKLSCHLCGASWNIPKSCSKCNRDNLKKIWVWTKQIEESLKNHFNDEVSIFRFDLDSTKNKTEKKLALEKLEKSDIIIATKMITTGFDFKNIGLIAVILAEQEFSFPSYNSEEKAYINIKQLIGRWNRLWNKTEIIIQTFIPDNEIIQSLSEKNYKNFFLDTLKERKLFNYPPFVEMLTLEYRDESEKKALDFMINLKNKLDLLNTEQNIEIILNKKSFKKFNKYHIKIILKWNKLRNFIENIKSEIFRNSSLSVIFE
jgi:primosomal protein N' (replication factor Y) (superfamily II helicase)